MRAKLALFLTLTTGAVAASQGPPPTAARIVGVVFDSVRFRPMAGAQVRVDTTSLVTTTDADGRFRFDSVPPGERWLRVDAPVVDTLGIMLRSTSMQLRAGETRATELATPTPESFVQRFCGAAWRARGPAALMGRVRDAESGNPAIGVKVSLVWYEIETTAGLRKAPRVREAIVGPDGTYRICGLPAELEGRAQVIRGTLTSGDVPIAFGSDVLALRSMSIAGPDDVIAVAPATDSGGAAGPPPPPRVLGSARLTGRVLDKVRQPIAGARVQLEGTARAIDTRANGEFTLDSLPPGTQTVSVRKLGYAPAEVAVDLASRDTRSVTLEMGDFVPVLETVRVSAERERALDGVGYQRRKRVGSGWYLDGRELEGHKASLHFSDVLRTAPGILIQRGAGDRQYITSARDPANGCVAIWIDGSPWQQMQPGDVDDFVRPYELAAIEVYSPMSTPSEYQQLKRGNCSTVVVWTERRLDRIKR